MIIPITQNDDLMCELSVDETGQFLREKRRTLISIEVEDGDSGGSSKSALFLRRVTAGARAENPFLTAVAEKIS